MSNSSPNAIPPELHRKATRPSSAWTIVSHMLLSADADVFRHQRARLDAPLDTLLFAQLADLPDAARLPLFQHALEGLRGFPDARIDAMLETARKIVEADGKVDALEYALLRLFRQVVHRWRNPVVAGAARPVSLAPAVLAEAANTLLSAVAYAGCGTGKPPVDEFQIGAASFPDVVRKHLSLLPQSVCTFDAFERALIVLENIVEAQKRDVITGVANIACADNVNEPSEDGLVRVVATVLGCQPPVARA